nr:MAG TPA: hypothetical protein [Caudoviricetes sp.]
MCLIFKHFFLFLTYNRKCYISVFVPCIFYTIYILILCLIFV